MSSFKIHIINKIYIDDLLDNLNVMGFKPNVMLIGIFSRRNGCFPRQSRRGLKSCKLFTLMT